MADLENVSTVMPGTTVELPAVSPPLYSYDARIAFACLWSLAAVLGIMGNSLVISSVILCKRLRTITNAFVVNLSIADFWTSISYPWEVVAVQSMHAWPLKTEFPCIVAAVQLYTGFGASLYTLAAIAFNRSVLVTKPVHTYQWWFSTRKVVGMIAATWVIPFVVFFLPPIIGVGAIGYDPQDYTCSDKDEHPRGPDYNLAQSLGLYPVPMVIIVSSYTALYVHLRRHFRKQKKRSTSVSPAEGSNTFTVVTESEGVTTGDMNTSARRVISRQQLAITKNLFMVFCIFFLLLSPYFISLAVPTSRKFALYGLTIALFNSCVNPIIYATSHPQFKVVLRKIIKCRFSEIPEPSDWLKSLLLRRRRITVLA